MAVRLLGIFSGCLVSISANAGERQPISLVGTWRADLAHTTRPYGPPPKNVTLEITRDDAVAFDEIETVTWADGIVQKETLHATYDGKPHALHGSPNDVTVVISRLSPPSIRLELSTRDGFRAVITCTIQPGGKMLVCNEVDIAPSGIIRPARSVYLRD